MSHTPGPWEVKTTDNHPPRYKIMKNHTAIVDVTYWIKEVEANANLIAAAPELLEAAKLAVACLKPIPTLSAACANAVERIEKAIAKAEVKNEK